MDSQATSAPARVLSDSKGRVASKLRISVTDRCNFACLFCMPDKSKVSWLPGEDILSFQEIGRVATVLASLGVERIRVTGGEPLLRPGVDSLVASLVGVPGIRSVDMTTNGWFLEKKADSLKAAGLRGVTVSLHSLKADRFAKISGIDALDRVLRGIEKALDVGLDPVKVNSVAIRGYNEDEILDLVDYAASRGVSIRFIEFMPLDGLGEWKPESVVSGKEILDVVRSRHALVASGRRNGETASLWKIPASGSDLGLITPISEPFCDDCDRLRLTSDGKLLSCLFDTQYHDLKPFLRGAKADGDGLEQFMIQAVRKKPEGIGYMPWIKDGWEKPRNMNAIGG